MVNIKRIFYYLLLAKAVWCVLHKDDLSVSLVLVFPLLVSEYRLPVPANIYKLNEFKNMYM